MQIDLNMSERLALYSILNKEAESIKAETCHKTEHVIPEKWGKVPER
jgi:hypothetical protein